MLGTDDPCNLVRCNKIVFDLVKYNLIAGLRDGNRERQARAHEKTVRDADVAKNVVAHLGLD